MTLSRTIIFFCFWITGCCLTLLAAQDLPEEVLFSQHRCLPGYGFSKMKHPELFQGNGKRENYFEGWYFKMVSANGGTILSIIPGIALSSDGKMQHAFIQIIDGKTTQSHYYSFPIGEFAFSRKEFAIRIGRNYFSANRMILDIRTDSSAATGTVEMSDRVALPSCKLFNSGIMGWYRFVPLMQCYHGVVSLTNQVNGSLVIDRKVYDFQSGSGYIEKDWGSSMPSAWIWIQSNNFGRKGSSFMLSIAHIPWLGKAFTGFLGFYLYDGRVYRFATYTHARLKLEHRGTDTVNISIIDRKLNYTITAIRTNTGSLKAPVKGSMDRRILESIDAKLWLTVRDKQGKPIARDSTAIAGFEMVGDQTILIQSPEKKRH
jgi:hypothetical protein